MRIVADRIIFGAKEAFESLGEVESLAADDINKMSWKDINVLLVRTKCPITADKIRNTQLKFVGTATAGFDHFDIDALESAGIAYGHSPGCNAESVVDFVIASLCHLSLTTGEDFRNKKVGIVGCGQTGGRLARRLEALDVDLNLCDPPLQRTGSQINNRPWKSLEEVLRSSDILSLHVPLVTEGQDPTFHMIGDRELGLLGHSAWFVNACRGEVVSSKALWNHIPEKLILDVWENEPLPSPDLVQVADIATAHVAGHSVQGKINGTIALREQLCGLLEDASTWDSETYLKSCGVEPLEHHLDSSCSPEKLFRMVVDAYDLESDDQNLRACVFGENRGAKFQSLRNDYRVRQDFKAQKVSTDDPHLYSTIEGLGLGLR